MQYENTQTAPLYLLLVGIGIFMLFAAWLIPELVVQLILFVSGGIMLLLAFCFQRLTVRDECDQLLISFGPLSLFRKRIHYSDIETVEQGRTTILDGWGIHMSPSGGWTWNLWGFDCVDVYYNKGRKVRIGTDDPARLTAFLQQRVGEMSKRQ